MPLPLLSHDQLLTANFFDFRQIVLCKLPKHIWRDVKLANDIIVGAA